MEPLLAVSMMFQRQQQLKMVLLYENNFELIGAVHYDVNVGRHPQQEVDLHCGSKFVKQLYLRSC